MSTILIVDDMPIFREPIAATLRLFGYETISAASAPEALDLVQKRRPDLILLDIAMPQMDGITCLKLLRADPRMRDIPVIMLTALSERAMVERAAHVGVQGYLLKTNFSTEELTARIREHLGEGSHPVACADAPPSANPSASQSSPRAAPAMPAPGTSNVSPAATTPSPRPASTPAPTPGQTSVTPAPITIEEIRAKQQLRGIQPVLQHVIKLTQSSASSLQDIAAAVRLDQALSLRLLAGANSSAYGAGTGARNIPEAVKRLGMTSIRNLAIAILTIDHFDGVLPGGLVPQHFWEHSLATAFVAEDLASAIHRPDADQLFLAGLLHDIGRMVIDDLYPDVYRPLLDRCGVESADLSAIERHALGFTHADVTRAVLEEWRLPRTTIEAAAGHDSIAPDRSQRGAAQVAATVVALANRIAHAVVLGNSGAPTLLSTARFVDALDIAPAVAAKIARGICDRVNDTELFYACSGSTHLREAFSRELASQVAKPPRIAVIARRDDDPVRLFCDQMGWSESERPTVAVVSAAASGDLKAGVAELASLEARLQRPLPLVVVRAFPAEAPLPDGLQARPHASVRLPVTYAEFIRTCTTLAESTEASAVAPRP